MRVHFHTTCWNEKPMLEFFFRHYSPWVDKFFIHDDGSDDGTLEILNARQDVEVLPYPKERADSFVLSAKAVYDTSWRSSIGQADWVVVANIDEHLYHPDMKSYLETNLRLGVNAIPSLGFQMISETFPSPGSLLWRDYDEGAPFHEMNKMQIFQPNAFEDVSFAPGRHETFFSEKPRLPDYDEVLNLHYKYLGRDRTFERHLKESQRHKPLDRINHWGRQKFVERDVFLEEFQTFADNIVKVHSDVDHSVTHKSRWWRGEKSFKQTFWVPTPDTAMTVPD